jgi:NADH:ubiquinone oxidoreductase subunit 3 (subunit A)
MCRDKVMVFNWLQLGILIFLIVGFLFAAVPLVVAIFLAPRSKGGDFRMPYECGMRPQGTSWIRFGPNYYIYALLFLAFDVDVLYLFPVATYYPEAGGLISFLKVFVFLAILVLAILYFWARGVFTWPRRIR